MNRKRWDGWIPRTLREDERLQPVRSVLAAVFRWLDRQLRGFYSAVGLFLSIGLGLALLAVWGFAGLAESVMEGETRRMDEGVLLWINQYASEPLDVVAVEITALGDGAVFGVLVLLIGLSRLYLGVHYPSDVLAGFAVGFAWATFSALAVETIRRTRTRPEP